MRIGATRNPALTLVLILLTCGIYYLYFIYVVSEETQEFLGERDTSPAVEVVLSVLTCGLYNIYWDYKIGKRVAEMCGHVGLPPTDNSVLYLVLDLVGVGGFGGLGLLNPILQQDSLNRVWNAAMTGPPPDPGAWPPAARRPVHPPPAAPAPPMNTAEQSRMRANAGAAWAALTAILAASLLLPPPGRDGAIGHLPSVCPFYNLTGLPCPGCGLTRAFVCLGHGQWRESLHWHPLGWLVYGVFLLLWLRTGLFWWRGVTLWPLSPPSVTRLGWCAAALLLITGIARIGWLTAHGLRF